MFESLNYDSRILHFLIFNGFIGNKSLKPLYKNWVEFFTDFIKIKLK